MEMGRSLWRMATDTIGDKPPDKNQIDFAVQWITVIKQY